MLQNLSFRSLPHAKRYRWSKLSLLTAPMYVLSSCFAGKEAYEGPQIEEKKMELRPPKASDPRVFSEKGHAYMDQRLYREAIICFQRAGDNRGLNMAQAWYYCGKGRSARGLGDHNEFLRCYQEAVDRFRKEQQFILVAQCLEEMNRFEEAGGKYIQSE